MRPLFKHLFYVLCLCKGETGGTWKEQGEAEAGASAALSPGEVIVLDIIIIVTTTNILIIALITIIINMNNFKISNNSMVSSRNKSRSRNREESEKRDAGRLKAFENIFGLGIFLFLIF